MSKIPDPRFAERVRASFERQNAMHLIQATMPLVEHGSTETLIVTQAKVFALKDGKETLCALMQQTIMVMQGKSEKHAP